MTNNIIPLGDYHVDEWLSFERVQSLKLDISSSLTLLRLADNLDSTLRAWSELQILDEIMTSKELVDLLNIESNVLEEIKHSPENFKKYRKKIILAWSNYHWKNKIESIYLQKINSLHRLSFNLINVDSSGLAFEIYHRIKANEEIFDQLYLKYDVSADKSSFGHYINKSLSLFPEKMHPALLALSAGDILKPFSNGKQFSILIMEEVQPAIFDEQTKDFLFYDEFSEWQSTLIFNLKNQHLFLSQEN